MEVSAVAEKYPEFQKLGVEVLSVSVDSVFVHKMWNDHELSKMINKDIPFPMLSDQDGSIGKMYGIYDEDSGVETRGRFRHSNWCAHLKEHKLPHQAGSPASRH